VNHLHPVFAQALRGFAPPQSAVHQPSLDEYQQALNGFDWQYQFSDDHTRYLAGSNALLKLRRMQLQLDPLGERWLATAGAKSHGAPSPDGM